MIVGRDSVYLEGANGSDSFTCRCYCLPRYQVRLFDDCGHRQDGHGWGSSGASVIGRGLFGNSLRVHVMQSRQSNNKETPSDTMSMVKARRAGGTILFTVTLV